MKYYRNYICIINLGDIDLKHLDIGTKRMLEIMKIGKFLMKYAVLGL